MNKTDFSIPKIDLGTPRLRNRREREVADAIALPIALVLIIIFYLLKILAKLLYKFKKALFRASLFVFIFFYVASNLTLSVGAPRADASKPDYPPAKVTPSPTPTNEDIIYSYKHGDIIYRIWGLESSDGVADDCLAKGKVNGFGFRENEHEHMCYDSFREVVSQVNAWVDAHQNMPLANMLCLYNQGIDEPTCTYTQNFMHL